MDKAFIFDLISNHFVFIGYDLNDLNITFFLNQVKQIVKQLNTDICPKVFIIKLTSRSKIDEYKILFYSEHKNMILVPLLTEEEQNYLDNIKKWSH